MQQLEFGSVCFSVHVNCFIDALFNSEKKVKRVKKYEKVKYAFNRLIVSTYRYHEKIVLPLELTVD